MKSRKIAPVSAAIACIESRLNEKLTLDAVAESVSYSKYHLHRMFTEVLNLTPHDYIQRRQLTEAAKRLAFSQQPILEIALLAGYESQQAFTAVFKAMYKQTPLEFRRRKAFYPLQLEFVLNGTPAGPRNFVPEIAYAVPADLPGWMHFVSQVIDGFPCLEEASHLEQVRRSIETRQALVIRDGPLLTAAVSFSVRTGYIDFLAVHPQYRRCGLSRALLEFLMNGVLKGRALSITTFREGDRADTGQRAEYKRLGFAESELLTEFGYPVQRLVL